MLSFIILPRQLIAGQSAAKATPVWVTINRSDPKLRPMVGMWRGERERAREVCIHFLKNYKNTNPRSTVCITSLICTILKLNAANWPTAFDSSSPASSFS